MARLDIEALDVQHNWHPCAQLKNHERHAPLVVEGAEGCYIELQSGRRLIDATASWWCKTLGHAHPRLQSALLKQMQRFEHVMFAGTTCDVIAQLSKRLGQMMPGLTRVFYAGDGACAVEIAMKMSLHYRFALGDKRRVRFAALCNGYHGETAAALSVTDVSWLNVKPYQSLCFEPVLIEPLYVSGCQDAGWHDASQHWFSTELQLLGYKDQLTAIIIEPVVQAAAGMKIISADFLRRLATFAKQHGIHLIADEIMTGFGRTGEWLACQHAAIEPDFVCLGKGITSGWLPFSAVLASDAVYQALYLDTESSPPFLHSHTYSGNALGASLALATIEVIEQQQLLKGVKALAVGMQALMQDIADRSGCLQRVRGIGAVVAADVVLSSNTCGIGERLAQQAIRQGALLRPIGNTVYWTPPLTIESSTLEQLAQASFQALKAL